MEFHEAGPGLVEQDVVAEVADLLANHAGVVDRAVVGALLDHRGPEWPFAPPGFRVGDQRIVADARADAFLVERVVVDRADQPVQLRSVSQEDRDRAAQKERAVMCRLVVVAVEQHQVALRDQRRQHDLVRGRRAVEYEIGLLGAENLCRGLLRVQRRPFVGQQVAKLEHRVVEVVTEHRLAQMRNENPPDRAAR